MRNSKMVGERSEGMVLAALLCAEKTVLQPFGDNQRYDLVIDEGGKFIRVQCKTARIKNGGKTLYFDTCSSQSHRDKGKCGYKGQADMFGVYSPDTHKVYLIPVGMVGSSGCNLRLLPTANGQVRGIRWASEYELNSGTASHSISDACSSIGSERRPTKAEVVGSKPTRRTMVVEVEESRRNPVKIVQVGARPTDHPKI